MEISGIILAGGRSTRMQSDKAFEKINNENLIDIVLTRITSICGETIIVTNNVPLYRDYEKETVRVITDLIPGQGPLSGIHAGLTAAQYEAALVTACDMPFINIDLARYMLDNLGVYDAVIPRIGNLVEPLFAVYSRRSLPVIEKTLQKGMRKVRDVFDRMNVRYLSDEEVRRFGEPQCMFLNVNNRDDLKRAEEIAQRLG